MTTRIEARQSVKSRMAAKLEQEPEKKTRKPRTPKEKPVETIETKAEAMPEVIPEAQPPVAKTRRISKPKAEIVPVEKPVQNFTIDPDGAKIPDHIAKYAIDSFFRFAGDLLGTAITVSQSNVSDKARQKALAKLSDEDRRALGL